MPPLFPCRKTAALALALALAAPTVHAAEKTYCNTYESGGKAVLMLIDRTSGSNSAKLRNAVEAARKYLLGSEVDDPAAPERKKIGGAALQPGQFLQVSTIADNIANRTLAYQDCRPGRQAGLSNWLDRPIDPTVLSQHDRDFHREASEAIRKAISGAKPTKHSAIADTLSKLSREYPEGGITRVVIVSDMLDNLTVDLLPKNGNTRGMTDFQLREAIRITGARDGFARLNDAEVIAFGFGVDDADRTPLSPDAARMVKRFWDTYLQRSDAQGELQIKY